MTHTRWAPAVASMLAFVLVTAIIGRDVLSQLGTGVVHDVGDPLLTGAILHWNAHHIPFTNAWWQFPAFYPTRDTLAFSEHLLGLSLIAAPVDWLTGDALVTSNLVTLLTFPLCAAAMYALVYQLTRSAGAAFVAGIAFGFAPYRISQLPHIQMLAFFWAPLALLGLHAYLESGRRRWLVLYGAAWMLQAAANGYTLVLFSVLVGLWVLWFVVARRNWRALAMITMATVAASLPLGPIVYKYLTVHAFHGFQRDLAEMRFFSADVAAVLCAPSDLAFWGWVRVLCRGEGQLFPGMALSVLCAAALCSRFGWFGGVAAPRTSRVLALFRSVLTAIASIYAAVLCSVLVFGPWQIDLGMGRASASSIRKPLLVFLAAFVSAILLSPRVHAAARRSSSTGFYFVAALVTWLLALGPTITLMEVPSGKDGPFMWLLTIPGVRNLRVPARFWLMTILCLAIVAGIFVARMLKGRSRGVRAAVTTVVALGLLGDGWVNRIGVVPAPIPMTGAAALTGQAVLTLPLGVDVSEDVAAQWRAVMGGWKSINGYSGYTPAYYAPLSLGLRERDGAILTAFRRLMPLHLDVPADDAGGWRTWTTTTFNDPPLVVESGGRAVYQVSKLEGAAQPRGRPIPFETSTASCDSGNVGLINDGAFDSRWHCGPYGTGQQIVVDLRNVHNVSGIGHALGIFSYGAPAHLSIELSLDGNAWRQAWSGWTLAEAVRAALEDPKRAELLFSFDPMPARFVRVRQIGGESDREWSIVELRVFEPS